MALLDCRPTNRHCNLLPLQDRRDLQDLTALLHLEELDISDDLCQMEPDREYDIHTFHFSNTDCLKLADLTTLQTLNVSQNAHINDSGFKVRIYLPVLQVQTLNALHSLTCLNL